MDVTNGKFVKMKTEELRSRQQKNRMKIEEKQRQCDQTLI